MSSARIVRRELTLAGNEMGRSHDWDRPEWLSAAIKRSRQGRGHRSTGRPVSGNPRHAGCCPFPRLQPAIWFGLPCFLLRASQRDASWRRRRWACAVPCPRRALCLAVAFHAMVTVVNAALRVPGGKRCPLRLRKHSRKLSQSSGVVSRSGIDAEARLLVAGDFGRPGCRRRLAETTS